MDVVVEMIRHRMQYMFSNNLVTYDLYQVSSAIEHSTDNREVSGLIPLPGTIVKCIAEQTNGGEPMSSVLHYGN